MKTRRVAPGRSRGASVSLECWAGQRAWEIIVKEQAETERWRDRKAGTDGGKKKDKMKITHLEQSLLNYPPHVLPPLGDVGVELVQIRGER